MRAPLSIAAVTRGVGVVEPRGGDLGADRGAQRKKQRKGGERVEILGPPARQQIAVEHDVGRALQTALHQIHEQEGEIVEQIAGGDQRIELDGIEQNRAAVDQHDVAEVEVAVAAADQTALPALDQKRAGARMGGTARIRQYVHLGAGNSSGMLPNAASFWSM